MRESSCKIRNEGFFTAKTPSSPSQTDVNRDGAKWELNFGHIEHLEMKGLEEK